MVMKWNILYNGSIIPTKEKIEITFKNPSFFLGLRFLDEINLSTLLNNLIINFFLKTDVMT